MSTWNSSIPLATPGATRVLVSLPLCTLRCWTPRVCRSGRLTMLPTSAGFQSITCPNWLLITQRSSSTPWIVCAGSLIIPISPLASCLNSSHYENCSASTRLSCIDAWTNAISARRFFQPVFWRIQAPKRWREHTVPLACIASILLPVAASPCPLRSSLGIGQGKRKDRPFTFDPAALDGDRSFHGFNKLPRDEQAQAASPGYPEPIALQPDKLFKNDFMFVRRYARTPVNYIHAHHSLFLPGGYANGCLLWRVAQRVGNKIAQYLLQARLICQDHEISGDVYLNLPLLLQYEWLNEIDDTRAVLLQRN